MLRRKWQLSFLSVLLVLIAIPASANSISYTLSGTLTSLNGLSQQQVTGSVLWNNTLGAITSRFYLSNTGGPAFCSSSCTLLLDTFAGSGRWAGDTEYLTGILSPSSSRLVLTIYNSSGRLISTYTGNVSWAVPDSGFPFDLFIAFAVIAIAVFKCSLIARSQIDAAKVSS